MSGMMWPVRTVGNPKIVILHTFMDIIFDLPGESRRQG